MERCTTLTASVVAEHIEVRAEKCQVDYDKIE
jgi:hypothetical protein